MREFLNFLLVQPTNSEKSSEITPTQTSTASISNSTAEDNGTSVTNSTNSPVNLTTKANTTQPTSKEPTKKTDLNVRSEEQGPGTLQEIPVFDPAKSVDLELKSGAAKVKKCSVVGFVIWFCLIAVISD